MLLRQQRDPLFPRRCRLGAIGCREKASIRVWVPPDEIAVMDKPGGYCGKLAHTVLIFTASSNWSAPALYNPKLEHQNMAHQVQRSGLLGRLPCP